MLQLFFVNLHRKLRPQGKQDAVKVPPTPKGEGGNEHLGIRRFCALVLTVGNPENFKSRQKQSNVTPLGCIV